MSSGEGRWKPPTTVRVSRMSTAELDKHAAIRGVSRSELQRQILSRWLEEHQHELENSPRQMRLFGDG